MNATICAQCKWLHGAAKTDRWKWWMCMKAPVAPGFNFVTGLTQADPPYGLCRSINRDGECPEYEAGQNCLSPDQYAPPKR